MARRLVALNVLLWAASAACMVYVAREVTRPAPPPPRPRPTAPAAAVAPAAAPPAAPPAGAGGHALIASRNLFSPTRTEAPAAAPTAAAQAAARLPKPLLHGVVLRDGASVAYLEDPTTKRVAGYRIGDTIAGGVVNAIAADRVTLTRPDGPLDVRLRDPAKPRPPAPPVTAGSVAPGAAVQPPPGAGQPLTGLQPGAPPQPVTPRVVPPFRRPTPPIRTAPAPRTPPPQASEDDDGDD